MNIPHCQIHGRTQVYVTPGCDGCAAEQRALRLIAQNPIVGPYCSRCNDPVQNWRKHKRWHQVQTAIGPIVAAGGVLRQLARYDRLMG